MRKTVSMGPGGDKKGKLCNKILCNFSINKCNL
jgi:hypothetical protein